MAKQDGLKFEKEEPIARLTITRDVSKMTDAQVSSLVAWLRDSAKRIKRNPKDFGKCVFRMF